MLEAEKDGLKVRNFSADYKGSMLFVQYAGS